MSTPQADQSSQPSRPNYDAFASISTPQARPLPQPTTPTPVAQQQTQAAPAAQQADPFAALMSSTARSSSPFHQPKPATPKPSAPSSTLLDLAQPQASAAAPQQAAASNGVSADDEWTFASSLPETTMPQQNKIQVHSSHLKIHFLAKRAPTQNAIQLQAQFSNEVAQPISEVHFQVAVSKASNLGQCRTLSFAHISSRATRYNSNLSPVEIWGQINRTAYSRRFCCMGWRLVRATRSKCDGKLGIQSVARQRRSRAQYRHWESHRTCMGTVVTSKHASSTSPRLAPVCVLYRIHHRHCSSRGKGIKENGPEERGQLGLGGSVDRCRDSI